MLIGADNRTFGAGRRVGVVFPAQHLIDGAGAAEVLRQQAAWLSRNDYNASLILAAPSLRPSRRSREARARILAAKGREFGFGATYVADMSVASGAWLGRLRLLVAVVARRLTKTMWRMSDDLAVSAALAGWRPGGGVAPFDGLILNYLSGLSLADALAPQSRQLLVMHDLTEEGLTPALRRAIGDERHLLALNFTEAGRIAVAMGRICPVGLPLDEAAPVLGDATGDRGPDLLFVGGAHPPNVEGLTAFIRDCFLPHLAPKGITLTVAGAAGPVVQRSLGDIPGVAVCGRVADLQDLYRSARLVIAPLLSGTGVSIKTLEAIAFGKAILTTPQGLRGLGPQAGPACPAPFDTRWADQVVNLLGDPALRGQWRDQLRRSVSGDTLAGALARLMPILLKDYETPPDQV